MSYGPVRRAVGPGVSRDDEDHPSTRDDGLGQAAQPNPIVPDVFEDIQAERRVDVSNQIRTGRSIGPSSKAATAEKQTSAAFHALGNSCSRADVRRLGTRHWRAEGPYRRQIREERL